MGPENRALLCCFTPPTRISESCFRVFWGTLVRYFAIWKITRCYADSELGQHFFHTKTTSKMIPKTVLFEAPQNMAPQNTDTGGYSMPWDGPVAKGLEKEMQRLIAKHGDSTSPPLYMERCLYLLLEGRQG